MKPIKRYLPLRDADGAWIARPDLFVLVRMAVQGDDDNQLVWQAYRHMTELCDNNSTELNELEALLERKYVRANMTERRYSAMVVVELLRLHLSDMPPILGRAVQLVARHVHLHERKTTEVSSLVDQSRKSFARYRSTCHLEAALRIHGASKTFENDPEAFHQFLAAARAIELFLDKVFAKRPMTWSPWRVPEYVQPKLSGTMTRLTIEERALVASA
ncbi:hypothetical protein ACFORG_06240 [Lutimaribacter marinistellae]|uniref:DUF4158 domain-containing protein n=1 Tax=Lutimaribacter marinistellae TaxID=1820329 RepID=A0ABV7TEW2_9RHOB